MAQVRNRKEANPSVMNWPNKIDVTINFGDKDTEKRVETNAKLLRYVADLYGQYGPHAEYETDAGQRFWIDGAYFQECQNKKTLPDIPIEVITDQQQRREKLAYGQTQLNQKKPQDAGLILPDGYKV